MIVKNETHIVKECLESMLPYIDRYDVTDTGSDDGTPELIEQFMEEHGIPGEVYRSDWKGFGDHAGNIGILIFLKTWMLMHIVFVWVGMILVGGGHKFSRRELVGNMLGFFMNMQNVVEMHHQKQIKLLVNIL